MDGAGQGADPWGTAVAALQLADRLVEAIQRAVSDAGHAHVRPIHGFVFLHVAAGATTTADVAGFLGVTKQAAAQMVERLVRDGYLERVAHPGDQRARLLRLTSRGRRVTEVAEAAARSEVGTWQEQLGDGAAAFEAGLSTLTRGQTGVRPTRR